MSLLDLPPSITALVASFLPPPLSSYAAISRDWQETIESLIFRHVHVNKLSRIETFGHVFVGSRRRWLNRLEVVALLPSYDSEACKRVETPEEQDQNNEAFTECVRNILEILQGWETDGNGVTRAGGITLDLSAHSPSDMSGQETSQAQEAKQKAVDEGRDIQDARYSASYLYFEADGHDLPTVKAVTGLYVDGQTPRHISGSTVARLAACFPRLTNLRAKIWDREAKSPDLRLKERNGKYLFSSGNHISQTPTETPVDIYQLSTLLCRKFAHYRAPLLMQIPSSRVCSFPPSVTSHTAHLLLDMLQLATSK